jgi:hypothetical protein
MFLVGTADCVEYDLPDWTSSSIPHKANNVKFLF